MEKKIIAVMVTLVVVAALVVAFVMVAAGGSSVRKAGGFTSLFDKLTNSDVNDTHDQHLELPASWENDKMSVKDTIVDMTYSKSSAGDLDYYTTTMWFSYMGTKWNEDHSEGTSFWVPVEFLGHNEIFVNHGLFSITIQSAMNISADFHAGESITLSTTVSLNESTHVLCFGDWRVVDTI